MEQVGTPLEQGEGNTKPRPKARIVPCKRWCFTLNNYSNEEVEQLEHVFGSGGYKWIMGREVGENGTPHIQGYVESDKRMRPLETFKNKRIHWEACRGNLEDNIRYCTKDGNYKTNIFIPRKVKLPEKLYAWQEDIINIILTEPDDRTIHWYWEPNGLAGKTTFCKYLASKYNAIPLEGKKNDILYCAAVFESDIYVWDLERTMEDYVSYPALEKIKNGFYMCSKYESKPIVRASPHVFVFANWPPKMDALSLDRWHVVKIEKAS